MTDKRLKVVVTDCDHPSVNIERRVLSEINPEFVLAKCNTEDEVMEAAGDADGIINQYAPITRRVIESLKRCRVIARYGVGVDNIDVEAATEYGIIVANVPDYCVDEVSTHAMALILACARGVTLLDRKIREKKWDFTLVKPLFRTQGKTLGLFGLGKIGRAVAKKASGFGFEIIAYDPYVSKVNAGIELVEFSKLLSDSDFISIHAPLTVETRHSFGEDELRSMRKTAYLINTARGAIIDEKALYKALKERWIAGAALDVMEKEPPDWENSLLKLDNIIITSHISFYSEESYVELKTKTAEAVLSVLKGGLPRAIVNPQVVRGK
ncbi:C-terminal binding protein [Candidatus Aerophobetes bacterium]|uniref:C-terminal binding protein n=1 Tax=Aerophobetes bacterium TaxID=2030807 RepID=A0A662CZ90_UNCAE|nr:MAG: C-terminal binding protein [Candidatus Aerophobetes bacterium]